MRIFLSFNSKDEPLAEAVRAGLLKLEPTAEIFFSPVSLGQGFWLPKLAAGIHAADAFLMLLGPKGVGPWQELEYHEAVDRHVQDNRFALVPVIAQSGQAPGLPFLRRFNWIEASEVTDDKALYRIFAALKGEGGSLSSPIWKLVRPYQSLEAMTEANADYFFGRAAETKAILEVLAGKPGRLPILIGASGTGKSSIAQAGVLSALKAMRWPGEEDPTAGGHPWPSAFRNSRNAWAWLVVRPGESPFEALAAAFTRLWITDSRDPERGPLARKWASGLKESNTLADLIDATQEQLEVRQGAKPARILIYLDQAEELYTRAASAAPKEAAHFSEVLASGLADPRLSVFTSLRADYFDHLQADQPLFSHHEHINVPPLTRTQLTEVVTGPAKALDVTFDEQVPERIVKVAAGEPGALPLVSYLLTDMWRSMVDRGDAKLRLPARAIDVGGVLVARAEEFLKDNQAAETALKRLLTLRLALVPTEGEPVRRQARRAECTSEEWALAETLAEQPWRLVVTSERERDGEVVAEVAHEAFLRAWPRLANWLRDERDFLVFKGEVEHREALWKEMGQADKALLVGLDLSRAEEWLPKRGDQLSEDLRAYIKRSVELDRALKDREIREKETQNRKLRRWAAFAAALALLAGGFGAVAIWKADESEKRAAKIAASEVKIREERDRSLETQSRYLADLANKRVRAGDAAAGILYAISGLPDKVEKIERPVVEEAERALLSGTQALHEAAVLKGHENSVNQAVFSPKGRRVLTASSDETARLWDVATGRLLVELRGHSEAVLAARFSPDGSKIVTASLDGTARIWSASTGQELFVLGEHTDTVWDAAFSADGQRVVTASEDNTARIWNVATGKQLAILKGHQDIVWSASFSPDGSRVVTASEDSTARVWDARSGQSLFTLCELEASQRAGPTRKCREVDATAEPENRKGHVDVIWKAQFSPDGLRIVTGSRDWSARVWDARTGALISAMLGHQRETRSVEFSPDGKFVLTAAGGMLDASDDTARIWDAETGKAEIILGESRDEYNYGRTDLVAANRIGHVGPVWMAAYSPDGGQVVTASEDGTARIWDTRTGRQVAVLRGHHDQVLTAIFSPDGKHVVTASKDGTARIWDVQIGQEFNTFKGHLGGVLSAAFSLDGERIISTSEDASARLWNAHDGTQIAILGYESNVNHAETVWGSSFSPDGKRLVTASEDWTAQVWDTETGDMVARLGERRPDFTGENIVVNKAAPRHWDVVWKASFSPDGVRVVTASEDGTARIWDANTGKQIFLLDNHLDAVWDASFSRDGRWVVTASRDTTARIWDAASGREKFVLAGHDRELHSAAFSQDSRRIVTAAGRQSDPQDNTARIWDVASGNELAILKGHDATVLGAAFSFSGRRVLTYSEDGTARVWDAETGKQVFVLSGHRAGLTSARFSPDDRRIVTASKDGTARTWNSETGKQIAILAGHDDIVWSAELSRDGNIVVTGSQDASIRLWDAETGKQIVLVWKSGSANGADPKKLRVEKAGAGSEATLPERIARAKQIVPRCLTHEERLAAFLEPAPPRWCITGEGRENERDVRRWESKWPYHEARWKDWLQRRNNGDNLQLPGEFLR